jgi:hypothetical protein
VLVHQIIDPELGRTKIRDLFIKDGSHIHLYAQGLLVDVEDFIILGRATIQTLSVGPNGIYRRAVESSKRVYPVIKPVEINADYAEGFLTIENRGFDGSNGLDGEELADSMAQQSAPINYVGYFGGAKDECSPFINAAQVKDWQSLSAPVAFSEQRQMHDGSVNGAPEKLTGMDRYYKCVVQNFLQPLAVQGPSGNNGSTGGPGGSTGTGLIKIKKSYLQIEMPINQPGLVGQKGLGGKGQLGPVQNPNFALSLENQRAAGTGPSIIPSPLARKVINDFFPGGRGPKGRDGRDGVDGPPGVANKFFVIDQTGKHEIYGPAYKRGF